MYVCYQYVAPKVVDEMKAAKVRVNSVTCSILLKVYYHYNVLLIVHIYIYTYIYTFVYIYIYMLH